MSRTFHGSVTRLQLEGRAGQHAFALAADVASREAVQRADGESVGIRMTADRAICFPAQDAG